MTIDELKIYNQILNRIDFLEEEIYALFEAQGKKINPVKRIFHTFSTTKKRQFAHVVQIELTLEDIRLLQDARLREVAFLKELLKEG